MPIPFSSGQESCRKARPRLTDVAGAARQAPSGVSFSLGYFSFGQAKEKYLALRRSAKALLQKYNPERNLKHLLTLALSPMKPGENDMRRLDENQCKQNSIAGAGASRVPLPLHANHFPLALHHDTRYVMLRRIKIHAALAGC